MKYVALALKILLLAYLADLFYFLATGYDPASPAFHPPFMIWLVDTFNLYIHEAGHFFFRPFGRVVYALGGSLMQVLVPLAFLIVTWRQSPWQIGYAGFWLGENMVNVSVYIQDAPYRKLKLIAQGLTHDWWWLLNGDGSVSQPMSEMVFFTGLVVCVLAIGGSLLYAVKTFREADAPATPSIAWSRQFPGKLSEGRWK
jgi:hypothetical protein